MPKNILMIGRRRRQDGDFPSPRQAPGAPFRQGGGNEVHGSRLCRSRRGADRSRSRRGRISLRAGRKRRAEVKAKAHQNAEERVLDALVGTNRLAGNAAILSARSCAPTSSDDKEMRSMSPKPARPAVPSRSRECRAPISASSTFRKCSARHSAAGPRNQDDGQGLLCAPGKRRVRQAARQRADPA